MKTTPLGQAYHEEVESLKTDGLSNADAIRKVAAKYQKKENAIRGGIHQYRARHGSNNGGASLRRNRRASATSVEGAIADARRLLEQALAGIDREVAEAKDRFDVAQQRYDALVATAAERKRDLDTKIKALS